MKTLKDYVNSIVFEGTDDWEQKKILGTLSGIKTHGNVTFIDCLDNSDKVRYEFKDQNDFDELYKTFGKRKWIIDCGKTGKRKWVALNFKQNNVWDFHGLTIELPGYGTTGLWGKTISNLNLNVESTSITDGGVSIGSAASGKLEMNNCNIRGYRVWLHTSSECELNNTTINCTMKSKQEPGCVLEIHRGPLTQTFEEISEEILEGGPVIQPIERLGIEGVDATTISIMCNEGQYADKCIIIGKAGEHALINKNLKSDVVYSDDGDYILYLSAN